MKKPENILKNGPLDEKQKAKKRVKKETLDSKLAEIDKQSQIVALEAKIAHVDEIIEKKNTRLSMVTEDENLSELADKTKIKAMQREVKDLSKRKLKMEKLYEKMSGKKYQKQEVVDEDLESSNYAGASNSDTSERAFRNNENEEIAEESNAGSNEGSDENSNYNSNENPESYSGLKKFREN